MIEQYERESGRDASRVYFYWAFGFFKLAVILEGIHARYLQGKTLGEGFDTIGERVPPLGGGVADRRGGSGWRTRSAATPAPRPSGGAPCSGSCSPPSSSGS